MLGPVENSTGDGLIRKLREESGGGVEASTESHNINRAWEDGHTHSC